MKNSPSFLLILLSTLFLISCSDKTPQVDKANSNKKAHLVLYNADVLTMEKAHPNAQAIAVYGDKIIFVGDDQTVQDYVGENTEAIDLAGTTITPGLIEGHGHYFQLGKTLTELQLRKFETYTEMVKAVEKEVKTRKPGDWIFARGWHQDKWISTPNPSVEGLPIHDALSAVSPDNPVILQHASGHGIFVNRKAMDIVGIDDNTPNPQGGEIVRNVSGKAIGMMRETAENVLLEAYEDYLAQRPQQEVNRWRRHYVTVAGKEALRNGITSFQDLGGKYYQIDLLKVMAKEANMPVRIYMSIEEEAETMKNRLADYRMIGYGDNFLTVRAIGEKVLDGALGTHGGWLLEPYADLPRTSGLNVVPIEEIRKSAELAIKHDYQLAIQGIGDRAVRELFAIYEEQFNRHPQKTDLRWRMEHVQVVHPDDLKKFAQLGVIPAVQGKFACSDGPWVVERLGMERAKTRGYMFKSMIASGALGTNGSDPPVEEISPISSFYCSVTRTLSDGSKFFPEQALTRMEALKAYTLGNATAAFEEDIKGSIKVGKLADLTVMSQNLLTVADDKIMDTEILMTIVGGKIKYRQ